MAAIQEALIHSVIHLIGRDLNQSAVGTQTVNIIVSDGVLRDTLQFVLTVNDINDDPEFTSTPIYDGREDSIYNYPLSATDVDDPDSALTFSLIGSNPSWLSIVNGVITGTPSQANVDTNRVTVQVADGRGGSNVQSFLITVRNENDAPTIQSIPDTTITESQLFSYQVLSNDVDGDQLTYSISGATWLGIDPSTGIITGTAANSDAGQHFIQVTVSDGSLSAMTSFLVTVQANTAPIFVNQTDTIFVTEGSALSFTFITFDSNGDAVTVNINGLPAWLSFDNVATISGTPVQANVGTEELTVTLTDGKTPNEYTMYVVVIDDPNPPQLLKAFEDLVISNQIPKVLDLSEYFIDPDGDQLIYSVSSDNSDVKFVLPTGTNNLIINRDDRNLLVDNARVFIDVQDITGLTLPTQEFNLSVFDGKNVRFEQNFPNPFSDQTTFRFNLKEDATISLSIYTLNGKLVKDIIKSEAYKGGFYSNITWDGTDNNENKLPSGIYYMILTTKSDIISKKLTIIR